MDVHGLQVTIEAMPGALRYAGLLGLAYGENLLFWLPGDIVGVSAALLAATGRLHPLPTLAAVTVGGWGGFLTYFEMARRFGLSCRRSPLAQPVEGRAIARAAGHLRRHGCWVVIGYRFCLGFRTAVAVSAGLLTLPRRRVWAFSLVSAGAWNGLVMGFADRVVRLVDAGGGGLTARVPWPVWTGLLLAVGALLVLKRFHGRARGRAGSPRPGQPAQDAGYSAQATVRALKAANAAGSAPQSLR